VGKLRAIVHDDGSGPDRRTIVDGGHEVFTITSDGTTRTCRFHDSVVVGFGDADDVTMKWDGTNLDVLAAADDSQIYFGDGTSSFDIRFYGNAAADFMEWDASASALKLDDDARIDLSACDVAAANTDGGVIKCGTSGSPVTEDTADMRFLNFNFDNGAASGDNRGMYLRLALTGGGGGEACRIFTNVDSNVGTAHGAHISMDFDAAAGGSECSGLGVAMRATLHIPNVASWAPTGTYAAIQAEIYADGANSDPAGMTRLSFFRVVNGGDATGAADTDDDACLFHFDGFTVGAGNMIAAKSSAAVSHTIRCYVAGTVYYIMLSNAQ